ncbi:MAG: hypothetical protein E7662_07600 [Ruminococcaceae bacterium]|nr:hypothetical protein [Oscillospiraceae bacterium]
MLFKKKIAAVLLSVLMILSALAVPAAAAEDNAGMTFTADRLFSLSKSLEKPPLTFEAVIRLPEGYTGRAGVILSSYSLGAAMASIDGISLEFNSKNLELYYETPGGSFVRHKFTDVPVSSVATGEWVHIAVVKDETAGKAHCYINGKFVQTSDTAAQPYAYTVREKTPKPLCVGGDYRQENDQYFLGEIREIAVFSDVRTADEIKADYAGIRAGTDNLLVWHKLSAGITSSEDLSGNGCQLRIDTSGVNWVKDKKPVTDYAYSFAVVGDTQCMVRDNPENVTRYYQWIVNNKDKKKIECVIGLGDITDSDTTQQWTAATDGISLLDGKVFYTLTRGNHDASSSMNRYLGTDAYYSQLKSRGESGFFKEGKMENAYCTFTAGKTDYLLLMLDYGATDDVLQWAGGILEKYPDRRAIITTHAYMNRDKTTLSPGDKYLPSADNPIFNDGDDLWEKFVSRYENIFLVLSGHISANDVLYFQQKGKNGNTVTQMLIDPQSLDRDHKDIGSLGLIAMFYFSEDGSKMTVEYYSILHDEYFSQESHYDLVLYESETPPETTAPQTTAAPETAAGVTDTESAPDTASQPLTDRDPAANSTVWIFVGIAAAVIIAAAALIVTKKKKK